MTEALNQAIITAVINAIRRTLFLPDSPIGLETRFAEDLSLDSLDIVELTMSLEETFKTEFPPEANSRFRSVSDLVNYLSRRYFQDERENLSAA